MVRKQFSIANTGKTILTFFFFVFFCFFLICLLKIVDVKGRGGGEFPLPLVSIQPVYFIESLSAANTERQKTSIFLYQDRHRKLKNFVYSGKRTNTSSKEFYIFSQYYCVYEVNRLFFNPQRPPPPKKKIKELQ